MCGMDTGSTVLRVNQSKLRKARFANDVVASRESDQPTPTTSSLPRERPDAPADQSQGHPAPDVYWITPQHNRMDVMELSDGLSTFVLASCTQYGLRTGECFP